MPTFLTFSPNPHKITFNSKKITGKTRTGGGWTYNFAGNEPDTISVEGYTMTKIPHDEMVDILVGHIKMERDTYVEWFLLQLQTLYKIDKEKFSSLYKVFRNAPTETDMGSLASLTDSTAVMQKISNTFTGNKIKSPDFELAETYLFYRDTIYRVYFESFSYTEDATDPSRYSYNMNLSVMWSSTDYLIGRIVNLPFWQRFLFYTPTIYSISRIRATSAI